MEKLNEYNGIKIVYKHSKGVFLTFSFALLMIGVLITSLFTPYLVNNGTSSTTIIGLDIFKYLFHIYEGKSPIIYMGDQIAQYFTNISFMPSVFTTSFYVVGVFQCFIIFFCLVLFIKIMFLISKGTTKNYFGACKTCIWLLVNYCIYFLFPITFSITTLIISNAYLDIMWDGILLGITVLIFISVCVTFSKCFKRRVYVKDSEQLEEFIKEIEIDNAQIDKKKNLPSDIKEIVDKAYDKNLDLEFVDIPNGITSLGNSAFANCINLKSIHIPTSVLKIGYNCFFNCNKVMEITYDGKMEEWIKIKKGSNWITKCGTNKIKCTNGTVTFNNKKQ